MYLLFDFMLHSLFMSHMTKSYCLLICNVYIFFKLSFCIFMIFVHQWMGCQDSNYFNYGSCYNNWCSCKCTSFKCTAAAVRFQVHIRIPGREDGSCCWGCSFKALLYVQHWSQGCRFSEEILLKSGWHVNILYKSHEGWFFNFIQNLRTSYWLLFVMCGILSHIVFVLW